MDNVLFVELNCNVLLVLTNLSLLIIAMSDVQALYRLLICLIVRPIFLL